MSSLSDLTTALLRYDFCAFVQDCQRIVNPGVTYLHNWHVEAIAYRLERVWRGECRRLIINLPPRHAKSLMVSVAFPAFVLGHDPRQRIVQVTYGADLSRKQSGDFRSVVSSDRYRALFPHTSFERLVEDESETSARGFRLATSINGTLTGLGGNIFLIDDPLKAQDAHSESTRSATNAWISQTLLSRLDDKKSGAIVVVMQRLHPDDLTGHLLAHSDDWELLSLPAIAPDDRVVALASDREHLWLRGSALHPERESLETLHRLRSEMGPDAFAAQYLQEPLPPDGGLIRRSWLRYYTPASHPPGGIVIQSWDTASKASTRNDYSVCTTWRYHDKKWYLMDVLRERLEYPSLKSRAIRLAQRYRPSHILIEDAATGSALAPEMRLACPGLAVRLLPAARDKYERLFVHQGKFESGQVLFPAGAPFLAELEAELLAFPHGRHDDQVDSMSQALAYQMSGYTLAHLR